MSAQHTPGPWRQGSRQLQSPELPTEIYAANGYLVARCNAGSSRGKQALSEHRAAIDNAGLIAAAPDLLEALRRCKFDSLNMSLDDLKFCSAAYAKATGASA